jgi:hypothetical protein
VPVLDTDYFAGTYGSPMQLVPVTLMAISWLSTV